MAAKPITIKRKSVATIKAAPIAQKPNEQTASPAPVVQAEIPDTPVAVDPNMPPQGTSPTPAAIMAIIAFLLCLTLVILQWVEFSYYKAYPTAWPPPVTVGDIGETVVPEPQEPAVSSDTEAISDEQPAEEDTSTEAPAAPADTTDNADLEL